MGHLRCQLPFLDSHTQPQSGREIFDAITDFGNLKANYGSPLLMFVDLEMKHKAVIIKIYIYIG